MTQGRLKKNVLNHGWVLKNQYLNVFKYVKN